MKKMMMLIVVCFFVDLSSSVGSTRLATWGGRRGRRRYIAALFIGGRLQQDKNENQLKIDKSFGKLEQKINLDSSNCNDHSRRGFQFEFYLNGVHFDPNLGVSVTGIPFNDYNINQLQ